VKSIVFILLFLVSWGTFLGFVLGKDRFRAESGGGKPMDLSPKIFLAQTFLPAGLRLSLNVHT
jgi:hypothetical protein